jgi:hypothetical protein
LRILLFTFLILNRSRLRPSRAALSKLPMPALVQDSCQVIKLI